MAEIKFYEQWVKKCFNPKEWSNFFAPNSAYCFLNKDKEGIWAGFVIGTTTPHIYPDNCVPLMDEEMRIVDEYRRNANVHPRPFEVLQKSI